MRIVREFTMNSQIIRLGDAIFENIADFLASTLEY